MRYSRFKSSLLGLEPQRRNRTNPKNKVMKSKKETKTKKENQKKDESIKPEPNAASTPQQDLPSIPSPRVKNESRIKNETLPTPYETQYTPAEFTAAAMPDTQSELHNRLLTPCSDTDMFAATQGFATSPANEMFHAQPTFDYAGDAAHCHEHNSFQPSPSYSPFSVQYELNDSYSPAAFCDHQHTSHPEQFGMAPSVMMNPEHTHVPVKHEEWDHFHH